MVLRAAMKRGAATAKVKKLALKTKRAKAQRNRARLDAFTRGVIWGMHVAGMGREDMLAHVRKKDGSKVVLNTY